MNRGSQCTTCSARYQSTGFNEAPIHESGKSKLRFPLTTIPTSLQ